MAWEQPPNREQPPDIEQVIKNVKSNLPKFKGGLVSIIFIILIAFSVLSSYYTVAPEEVGVVLRLGKYYTTTSPGLHFKIPLGVDKVYKVKTTLVHKQEFGFRTRSAGIRTEYDRRGYTDESLMLTGDLNVINLEWIVQYRIIDPLKYLFKVSMVERTIRDISEAVLRRIAGNNTFNHILTNRVDLAIQAQKEVQEILDSYDTGIDVVTLKFQDVNPPDEVKAAFNEVNEAIQEKERAINQAQEIYNNQVPRARGEAESTIAQAEGYAIERVNKAKGDVSRFSAVLKEYAKAKAVTRSRLYLETINGMLPRMQNIYIVDGDQKALLPLLQIGQGKAVSR